MLFRAASILSTTFVVATMMLSGTASAEDKYTPTFMVSFGEDREVDDCGATIKFGGQDIVVGDLISSELDAASSKTFGDDWAGLASQIVIPANRRRELAEGSNVLRGNGSPEDFGAELNRQLQIDEECRSCGDNLLTCNICCMFECNYLVCYAGHPYNPCENHGWDVRKLEDLSFVDEPLRELRRLEYKEEARAVTKSSQNRLKGLARYLKAIGNQCLGSPDELRIATEVFLVPEEE